MTGKPWHGRERALTGAERAAAYRLRRRAKSEAAYDKPRVRIVYRVDRRSKPKRWADAVAELAAVLDDYQAWRDALPPGVAQSAIADRLDDVLRLRDLVEQLADADLPKGFGRD